jgi:hypothetical protein
MMTIIFIFLPISIVFSVYFPFAFHGLRILPLMYHKASGVYGVISVLIS